jgi:hypothetical protein
MEFAQIFDNRLQGVEKSCSSLTGCMKFAAKFKHHLQGVWNFAQKAAHC